MDRQIMRISIAAIVMVLSLTIKSFAWKEPDGFRGIKWGTRIDVVAKMFNSVPKESGPQEKVIAIQDTVGDIPVVLSLHFFLDRFEMAYIEFDSRSFDKMIGIFFLRYGKPTDTTIAWTWLGKKATVMVGQTSNLGFATVESAKWVKKENDEREKKLRAAARDP